MYLLEIENGVYEKFERLGKKDNVQLAAINSKIKQILAEPHRFKSLRFSMAGLHRVHVMKSFVLVYRVDEGRKTVIIMDYDHHDSIYRH